MPRIAMTPLRVSALVFVVILGSTALVDGFARSAHRAHATTDAAAVVDAVVRDVSDLIARESAAVAPLAALVESLGDDHIDEHFEPFAEAVMGGSSVIASVQLAPNNVLEYVYPLEGNEAAVGLDLLADPAREALLLPAIRSGAIVVQGPVELVQGGVGVIVRKSVRIDGEHWGFAAILLDWPAMMAQAPFDRFEEHHVAAKLPGDDMVLFGDPRAFDMALVTRRVKIGATDTWWEVAVAPLNGVPSTAPQSIPIWAVGAVIAAMAAALAHSLARRPQALQRAREQAVAELALAEARYTATFQHAGIGILVVDSDGHIMSANPAMRTILGVRDEEIVRGKRAGAFLSPERADRILHEVRHLPLGEVHEAELVVSSTGEERWVRVRVTRIAEESTGSEMFVVVARDFTERRRAQEKLAESERLYRQLFELAPIAIQREDFSAVAERFDQLRRQGVNDLDSYIDADPSRLPELLSLARVIDVNPAGLKMRRQLGGRPGESTLADRLNPANEAGFRELLLGMWEGRTSFSGFVNKGDSQELDIEVRTQVPVVDGFPDHSAVIATFADVTALHDAQRRLEALLQSKDRFLASVAHELRTPLTAVVGFAQELIDNRQMFTDAERREFEELIAFYSGELSMLIEDLLVWARADIGEVRLDLRAVDLREAVARTLTFSPGLEAILRAPEKPVTAHADPVRVRQIVRNLVTNAFRHGGSNVEVRVGTEGTHAVVEVADDGAEIPAEAVERIFEPYGRSGAPGSGPGSIGLGLTVSRSLARLQDGDLEYVRRDGHNVFRLSLPLEAALVEA